MDYSSILGLVDFTELSSTLMSNSYYEVVFPFLLMFAVLHTVLSSKKIKLFQNKKTGEPRSAVVFIVSLIVSLFGVTFETSEGYRVGDLLMMMFPNISALTIGVLALYVIGAILGKNFFKDLFRKDYAAYVYFAIGAVGLGAVIFYLGIAMGLWDHMPIGPESYWNIVLAVAFLILGIVFIIIEQFALGVLLLVILGTYIYNYGEGFILEYFIDPVVFIFVIVIFLLSYIGSDKEKDIKKTEETMKNQEATLNEYGDIPDFESRIKDIVEEAYKANKKKLEKMKKK